MADKLPYMPCRWWDQWAAYSGYGSTGEAGRDCHLSRRPGEIDNTSLLQKYPAELRGLWAKKGLREGVEYRIVTAKTWNMLHQWYNGGPALLAIAEADSYRILPALQLTIRRSADNMERKLYIDITVCFM